MTATPATFVKGAVSLIAGLGVTIRAFFQPVVTSQYPRELLEISPRFRGHTKLVADSDHPDKNACIACGICVRNCPSGSIKNVEGEKREGEKRKTATTYILDYTTCSQCGICVETCPSDALGFSADFNLASYKKEDFYFDLVKEFEKEEADGMTLSEIIFLLVVLTTMAGGAMAILSGSIIYAMMGLVVAMFGVAGLYIYLNSPFLAMMQILIYVGAISVLIAFAIMLAGPLYRRPKEWTTAGKLAAALVIAGFSLLMFFRFAAETFPRVDVQSFAVETKNIGRLFFDELMLPFELISLLIVVGILGAIMLALFSREKK